MLTRILNEKKKLSSETKACPNISFSMFKIDEVFSIYNFNFQLIKHLLHVKSEMKHKSVQVHKEYIFAD